MNTLRIVKEITEKLNCYVQYHIYDSTVHNKDTKVLELCLGQSLESEQWENLTKILDEYDLKILDLGIHGYDDCLYFDIIEKR